MGLLSVLHNVWSSVVSPVADPAHELHLVKTVVLVLGSQVVKHGLATVEEDFMGALLTIQPHQVLRKLAIVNVERVSAVVLV